MTHGQLDELDERIVALLRENGRRSNRDVARAIGVAETTIRNRMRRLVNEEIIQISARVNLSRLGHEMNVHIGISCDPGRVADVANELANMREVRFLSYVVGRYDLLIAAAFRTRDELLTFLLNHLGKIQGVQRTETIQDLKVVKREYDFWG
jgi:Lrp/AsnC family transcriptional regulator for asnA, asnC and gidA